MSNVFAMQSEPNFLTVQIKPRDIQIAELLLQGCDNGEIAAELKMGRRTVKARMNKMFLQFNIVSGIKRVKLAVLLFRRQKCNGTLKTSGQK